MFRYLYNVLKIKQKEIFDIMKSLKLYNEDGEKNLDALSYSKFRCRITKGPEIPDWRIVKVDEPNISSYYITFNVMAGEDPISIIQELDTYKGKRIDIVLEHLDANDNVVLTQLRSGYNYAGAGCHSFRGDVEDERPLQVTVRFTKPKV